MRIQPFIIALIIVSASAPADAQSLRLEDNAALWYWRAIHEIAQVVPADSEIRDVLTRSQSQSDSAMPPELAAVLSDLQFALSNMRYGASLDHCRFVTNPDAGPGTRLLYLEGMRECTRFICLDARDALSANDSNRLTEDLITGYRIANHVSDGGVALLPIAAKIMVSEVDAILGETMESGVLAGEYTKRLVGALREIQDEDPFGFKRAVRGEHRLWMNWFDSACSGPQGRRIFLELSSGTTIFEDRFTKGHALYDDVLSESQFRAGIRLLDEAMRELIVAFEMEDRAAGREVVNEIMGRFEAAPLSQRQHMVPGICLVNFPMLYESMCAAEDELSQRIAFVEASMEIDHSPTDPPP